MPREQAYQAIEKANLELNEIQEKNKDFLLRINEAESNLLELKSEESKSTDIGTLKFVANLFNLNIETIVKWFTIMIVLVFDPLAVSLILAYNNINQKKEKKGDIILEKENLKKEYINIENPINVKYKDK